MDFIVLLSRIADIFIELWLVTMALIMFWHHDYTTGALFIIAHSTYQMSNKRNK